MKCCAATCELLDLHICPSIQQGTHTTQTVCLYSQVKRTETWTHTRKHIWAYRTASNQLKWISHSQSAVPAVLRMLVNCATDLCFSSNRSMLSSFCWAARWSAVFPWRSVSVTSTSASNKASTASFCCVNTARCKGVWNRCIRCIRFWKFQVLVAMKNRDPILRYSASL